MARAVSVGDRMVARRAINSVQPRQAVGMMLVRFYAARDQMVRQRVAAVPRFVYGMHVLVNNCAFNSAQLGNDGGVLGVIHVIRNHPFGVRGFGRRQMQYEAHAVQRNVRRGVHNAREFDLRMVIVLILSCRAKMHVRCIKPVWINKKTHIIPLTSQMRIILSRYKIK